MVHNIVRLVHRLDVVSPDPRSTTLTSLVALNFVLYSAQQVINLNLKCTSTFLGKLFFYFILFPDVS
jgi:hypothetical protein